MHNLQTIETPKIVKGLELSFLLMQVCQEIKPILQDLELILFIIFFVLFLLFKTHACFTEKTLQLKF